MIIEEFLGIVLGNTGEVFPQGCFAPEGEFIQHQDSIGLLGVSFRVDRREQDGSENVLTLVPVIKVTNLNAEDRLSMACTTERSMSLFIRHSSGPSRLSR